VTQVRELPEAMGVEGEQPQQGDEERDRRALEALEDQHALKADHRGELVGLALLVADVGPHIDLERQRRERARLGVLAGLE
jgi:hypothetical protein